MKEEEKTSASFEMATLDPCIRYLEQIESAIVDGESAEQAEDVRAHLGECERCRLFFAALQGLQEVDPPCGALVSAALAEHATKAARRRVLVLFAPLAAAAVFAAALAVTFGGKIKKEVVPATESVLVQVVEGSPERASQMLSQRTEILAGDRLATRSAPALLRSGHELDIALDAASKLTARRLDTSGIELELEAGRLAVALSPSAKLPLAVLAGGVRVFVTGTVFAVESTGRVSVDVVEGAVRVEPVGPSGRTLIVRAGERFSAGNAAAVPLEERDQASIRALLAGLAPAPTGKISPVAVAATADGQAPEESLRSRESARGATAGKAPSASDLPSRPEAPRPSLDTLPLAEPASPTTADEVIRSARQCRKARDWECAAAAYAQVVREFPSHPDAATALVPLAELELVRLGRPEQALAHFRAYRQKSAGGALEQEAHYGICRALAALGWRAEETNELRSFLQKYPDSLNAKNARLRLAEISR